MMGLVWCLKSGDVLYCSNLFCANTRWKLRFKINCFVVFTGVFCVYFDFFVVVKDTAQT